MGRALSEILRFQNDDGGWSIYPGGPSNISLSVKCYLAGKLMGMSAGRFRGFSGPVSGYWRTAVSSSATPSQKFIFARSANTITTRCRLFHQRSCFFRTGFISISMRFLRGRGRSWCRLSILYAKKPFKKLAPEQGIDELICRRPREHADLRLRFDRKKLVSWRNFFLVADRLVHLAERVHIRPLRQVALKRAEKWMLERLEMSDGLGAIYPAMLNSIIALRHLGYSVDDPQVIRAMDEFEKLGIEDPGVPDDREPTFRMQPCMSPVWDTALCGLRAWRSRCFRATIRGC